MSQRRHCNEGKKSKRPKRPFLQRLEGSRSCAIKMLQNRVKQFSKLGSCVEWRSRLWGTADLFRARSGDMSGVGGS